MKKWILNIKKTAIAYGISLVFLLTSTGCSQNLNDISQLPPQLQQTRKLQQQEQQFIQDEAPEHNTPAEVVADSAKKQQHISEYPDFSGELVIIVNNNVPDFAEFDPFTDATESFEYYSELDAYGRCGTCYAFIGIDLMPTEERKNIGHVRPSGWQTVKYDIITDRYLFNRCHLIGFQLTGENDNVRNLITGTRYLNTEGMLPYENKVANYIKETQNHVYYRVTPIYEATNPVAKGVQMEAYSMEDHGAGICFNIFIYNIQPGIRIDYATGESVLDDNVQIINEHAGTASDYDYILNISSEKFHYGNCSGVSDMKEHNKEYFNGTREDAIDLGYAPCGNCKP